VAEALGPAARIALGEPRKLELALVLATLVALAQLAVSLALGALGVAALTVRWGCRVGHHRAH
jgi:hypothetical protein